MISFDINNQQTLKLTQETHDGCVMFRCYDSDSNVDAEWSIEPGDVVMLLNYYRNCKDGIEVSDYIVATPKGGE